MARPFSPQVNQITLHLTDNKDQCILCSSDVKMCGTCLSCYRVTETPDSYPGCKEHECTSCCTNVLQSGMTSGVITKSPMPAYFCKPCFLRLLQPVTTPPCTH